MTKVLNIVLLASILAVVLLLIYYAWRQTSRSMALLQELNEQFNLQKTELESTVLQLKDASIEKGRIMWMVAYVLRNPLGNNAELLYRTAEMMQFKAKEKGQNLVYNGLGQEMIFRIDPEKIIRAVFNLIGNAVKFSPKGGEIVISLEDMKDKVVISVNAHGGRLVLSDNPSGGSIFTIELTSE